MQLGKTCHNNVRRLYMKKFNIICFSILFTSTSAFASGSKAHVGGTVISVPSVTTSAVREKITVSKKQAANFGQKSLFDYGAEDKNLSKSEKEYREFLSIGTYSRSRSIGGNSYANVGRGSYGGNGGARAIYSRSAPSSRGLSSAGGFASLNRTNVNGGFATLGGRRNGNRGGYATLGGRRNNGNGGFATLAGRRNRR